MLNIEKEKVELCHSLSSLKVNSEDWKNRNKKPEPISEERTS